MSSMTVDGMISGMSTSSLVDQLINVEAATQRALQARQEAAKKQAAGYRSINTKFDALRTAAENLLKAASWSPVKVSSTAASITTTTSGTPSPGALTFSVISTAATHSVVSATTWAATTDPSGYGPSLEVFNSDGTSRGVVAIGGTGSLADTVSALNKSTLGVTAAAVQVAPGQYRLQVTSKTPGATDAFTLGAPGDFAVSTAGADAHLKVGTGPGAYDVYSSSNSFVGLMPGVTLNVTKPETDVTVTVASDPDTVTASVKAVVDAANAALAEIKKYGATGVGSTAVLSGDFNLTRLTGQVLNAVSSMVGTDGSPGLMGVQLTRDGTVKFDADKFAKALAADPAATQRVLGQTAAAPGADGTLGTADDVAAVPGMAGRLLSVAKAATDKTTGSLTLLAQGRDKSADDMTKRIEDWDLRLEAKRKSLMRQFTAMEVALGGMKSQSSWLAGQIGSLSSGA